MTESKITVTDRLRREGKWEEASLWRDEKRKELRSTGQSRADANEESWQAMIDQFPPLPGSGEDQSPGGYYSIELVDVNSGDFDDQADLVRDTLWAYESLCMKGVEAEDAPSLGAWSLLNWARQNRNRFFEVLLPKAMAAKEKQPDHGESVMEDPGIKDIEKMLADLQLDWERNAVADTDETIKSTVESHMSGWELRFQLDLGAEARESWMLQMVKLVDDMIGVAFRNPETFQAT